MYIVIDVGGTNTRVASSVGLTGLLKIVKFPTRPVLSDQISKIENSIKEVSEGENIKSICIGVPGVIDRGSRKFIRLSNYKVLNERPFGDVLPKNYHGIPFMVENDAVLGALGEAAFGAGKAYNVVAYITLGTGVGGVRIENKSISKFMGISEPGEHIISFESNVMYEPSGQRGSFEAFSSGKAFEYMYGISPETCMDTDVWEEYGAVLGIGLINVVLFWGPDVIVLGGGISNQFDKFIKFAIKRIGDERLFSALPILKAKLGDSSVLFGGLAYTKANI